MDYGSRTILAGDLIALLGAPPGGQADARDIWRQVDERTLVRYTGRRFSRPGLFAMSHCRCWAIMMIWYIYPFIFVTVFGTRRLAFSVSLIVCGVKYVRWRGFWIVQVKANEISDG